MDIPHNNGNVPVLQINAAAGTHVLLQERHYTTEGLAYNGVCQVAGKRTSLVRRG